MRPSPSACLLIGTLSVKSPSSTGPLLRAKAQDDIKKLVAYSSVKAISASARSACSRLNSTGLTGSLLQMINHGLSTGALFLIVGMIYERYHTRMIADYSGLGSKLKAITFCMVFVSLSSVGLPGLNGFIGGGCSSSSA